MCDIFRGQKTLFFKKCPKNGLVSEKNTSNICYIRGGGEGGDPNVKNVTFFNFFFTEGFPNFDGDLEKRNQRLLTFF